MEGTDTVQETNLQVMIKDGIKRFDMTEKFFKDLAKKAKSLKIDGVDDKEGYAQVKEAIAVARTTKTSIEKKRKEIKEESLAFGRAVDSEARRLTDKIMPIYKDLQAKKDIIDKEKERIRQEKKREKELFVQKRAEKLMEIGMTFDGTKYFFEDHVIQVAELPIMNERNFNKLIESASETIKIQAKAREEEEKKIKLQSERMLFVKENGLERFTTVEQTELLGTLSEKEYNIYLALVQEQKEEFEREEAEKKEKQRELQQRAQNRLRHITPLLKYSDGQTEIPIWNIGDWSEEDFNDTCKELEMLKVEAQKKEKEAIKAEKERQKRAKKEAEAAEKKRIKALAPDKEKLVTFAEQLKCVELPELKTKEAQEILLDARRMIGDVSEFIKNSLK